MQGPVTSQQFEDHQAREQGRMTTTERIQAQAIRDRIAADNAAIETLSNDDWQDLRNRYNDAIRTAQAAGKTPVEQLRIAEKATGVTRSQMIAGRAAHPGC